MREPTHTPVRRRTGNNMGSAHLFPVVPRNECQRGKIDSASDGLIVKRGPFAVYMRALDDCSIRRLVEEPK